MSTFQPDREGQTHWILRRGEEWSIYPMDSSLSVGKIPRFVPIHFLEEIPTSSPENVQKLIKMAWAWWG